VCPDCAFDQPPEPEPDIVADCVEGRVGIELTEFHPSGVEKRLREGEQEILTNSAKQLYEQAGLPPVNVFINWSEIPHLSKGGRRSWARLLFDLVAENRPYGEQFSRDIGDGEALLHPDLPIRALSISWASSLQSSEWRDWNFHKVKPPDADEIQQRLRYEENKLDISQESYLSRWLVLVAGAAGPSTWTDVGASLDGKVFVSRYDRAFLFLVDRRKVVELALRRE